MIYILEGVHCTGKTTLAKRLSEALVYPVYRVFRDAGIPRENRFLEERFGINNMNVAGLFIADLYRKIKFNAIFDRCYFDEYLFGKSRGLKRAFMWWQENMKSCHLFYLWAPAEIILERAKLHQPTEEHPTVVTLEEIKKELKTYNEGLKELIIPHTSVNTSKLDLDGVFELLFNFITCGISRKS